MKRLPPIHGVVAGAALALSACAVGQSAAPANPPVHAGEKTTVVVMLGDSTTQNTGVAPGLKLVDRVQTNLAEKFHLTVTMVNSGKGSDTVKGGFARVQEAVIAHDPDVVTISFGLNDTGYLTPDEYRDYLERLIQTIQQKTHAKLLLVTSTPFNNARHAWGERFSTKGGLDEFMDANICGAMRKLAEKYKLPVCDLHKIFADQIKKDPALIDKLIQPDGVHVTPEGNSVSAENLAPMIAALIAPPKVEKEK